MRKEYTSPPPSLHIGAQTPMGEVLSFDDYRKKRRPNKSQKRALVNWEIHQFELKHIASFCMGLFGCTLLPYASPTLADYRPWVRGERVPIIGIWLNEQIILEDEQGELSLQPYSEDPLVPDIQPNPNFELPELSIQREAQKTKPERTILAFSDRSPAVHTELTIPDGAFDSYFESLALVEDGLPNYISRALVWGDSTIANDGIINNIRSRFQTRFGDGGPGFLSAQVDPRWSMRKDILRRTSGWSTKTIIFGGAILDRYGLAGTVSTTMSQGYTILGGPKQDESDERQSLNRFQVFYKTNPAGGSFTATVGDIERHIDTKDHAQYDGYEEFILPSGSDQIKIQAHGNGPVTLYGAALETIGPGVTWETLAVAGASIYSMKKQSPNHIMDQINNRNPNLVVLWTGGNELGYPAVKTREGKGYKKIYRRIVRMLKDGAPEASCLLIGPLDQGTRERGEIISKPTIKNMVRFQREVAIEQGCVYLDAQALMGGDNSFPKWMRQKPALASSDLLHLTRSGRALIGETIADLIEREYDLWRVENQSIAWEPEESIRDFLLVEEQWESRLSNDDMAIVPNESPSSIEL